MDWSKDVPTIIAQAVFQSTALLAAGWILSIALRRGTAAARHAAWTLVLAGLLAAPVLSLVVPSLNVSVNRVIPAAGGWVYQVEATGTNRGSADGAAGLRVEPGLAAAHGPIAAAFRLDWRAWIALVWVGGAALVLAWFLCGFLRLSWIARRAAPASVEWRKLAQEAARTLHLGAPVRLRLTGSTTMPLTHGLFRSEILLPASAEEWDEERRRVVMLHEVAHVKRRDCLTQLIARLACSLYWFHPLVWSAARQFLKERERASDDAVLAAGARASDYASHLLEVARSLQPANAWAAVAMARHSQLEGRLLAILDSGRKRGGINRSMAVTMAAAAICLVLVVAAMRPARAQAPEERVGVIDSERVLYETQGNYEGLERLAEVARGNFDYAKADHLLRTALLLREKRFGKESVEYARGALRLNRFLSDFGQKPAVAWQDVLAIQERLLGPNAPELAVTLYYMALDTQQWGQSETAEGLYQRALALATSPGPGDTTVGSILTKLALLDQKAGRNGEAEGKFNRAIAALQAAPDSPEFAAALEHFARFLRQQERGAHAEAAEAQAREIRARNLERAAVQRPDIGQSPLLRVGNGTAAPRPLYKPEPAYSADARIAKFQGTVVAAIEVGVDGRPYNIRLKRVLGLGLDEQAIIALKQWRFSPATRDGYPVPVQATVEITFRLL